MSTSGLEIDRSFDKARLLKGNCSQLKLYKTSNYPEIVSVVDYLFEEMVGVYGFLLSHKSSVVKLKYHIEFFVTNLYKTYCNDPIRVISYPRDRSKYSDKKSRYKRRFGLSYRYSVDGGKNGKPVINFLERQGYIETFSFQHDHVKPGNSFQSRMRATEKLIDLIETQHDVSEDMLAVDTSKDETIIVKGVKLKDRWVRYVDDNGKTSRMKVKGKRKVCKTPNKPLVRKMRENLAVINAVMDKAEITLDISEAELGQLNARLLHDLSPHKSVIDFSRKRLHRVFLDRRLDRGGRFWGPWYQNIPKEYRPKIMINGAPTLELDYSALHPNLLYALNGVHPPAGDLYELDGYSQETRNFMKGFFLRMINAKSREDAKGSIREAAFLKGKVEIPEELGHLEDKYLDPLIDKFMEKHKPIKNFLFSVNSLGNILQNIDAQIAEKVILYFAHRGVPVLPIHDSFRIDARLFDELRKVMHRVIYENFGRFIGISNDDFEPLLEGMFGKIEKDIEEAAGDKAESKGALFEELRGVRNFMTMMEELSKLIAQESIKQEYQQSNKSKT